MAEKNLWGTLPTGEEEGKGPRKILQNQATVLTEGTGGTLTGRVVTETVLNEMTHDLIIVAPYLNNYEVGILRASHGVTMYPTRLYDLVGEMYFQEECSNASEFETKLEELLKSKKVHQVIGSLLSQSSRPPKPGPGLLGSIKL